MSTLAKLPPLMDGDRRALLRAQREGEERIQFACRLCAYHATLAVRRPALWFDVAVGRDVDSAAAAAQEIAITRFGCRWCHGTVVAIQTAPEDARLVDEWLQ